MNWRLYGNLANKVSILIR